MRVTLGLALSNIDPNYKPNFMNKIKDQPSRRNFIKTFAYVAAAGCGLKKLCGNSAIGALLPEPATGAGYIHLKTQDFPEMKTNGQTLRLGFTAISGGGSQRRPVNTTFFPLLITRNGPGDYFVVDSNCTHASWMVQQSGTRLRCPVHGSQWQLDGTRISGPASAPLKKYDFVWQPSGEGSEGTLSIEVPKLGYSIELQPVEEGEFLEFKFLARRAIKYQILFRESFSESWQVVEHAQTKGQEPNQTQFVKNDFDSFVNIWVKKPNAQGFFGINNIVEKV